MFGIDLYPTPESVINLMLSGYDVTGKTVLEPSAGTGNIVDVLLKNGAEVLACEIDKDLQSLLSAKCPVIAEDFLKVKAEDISHVDFIVMNPPFSKDEQHIIHAFNIAPDGCKIIALCNYNTIKNTFSRSREELKSVIEIHGKARSIGQAFKESERSTEVEIGLIEIEKPSNKYSTEFEGFYMDEDPEEAQENGIMTYDFIRDVVNRYVESVKIFDRQLEEAVKMNNLTDGYFSGPFALSVTNDGKTVKRNDFKKGMQKAGWKFIFSKMNMQQHMTRGLIEDINKFVEEQSNVPFTMKNIYHMIEFVIGNKENLMNRAILEAFDKITKHHHDNRYNVEGWKTNDHYLVNEKFILPHVVDESKWSWNKDTVHLASSSNYEVVEDMVKAICFITGTDYNQCTSLWDFVRNMNMSYGVWYSWGFFEIKGFKKGTMHFKFNSTDLWGKFNQKVAEIKGFPLYESKTRTREKNSKKSEKDNPKSEQRILFEI